MKLYTEEQVKRAMIEARLSPWLKTDFLLQDFTPIELPSDEEIENFSLKEYYYDDKREGFVHGAKWMRDKIQGGNQ